MFRPNRLKTRILAGEKSLGTWLQSACPIYAEMAAIAGMDFFIVDQEHGKGGLEDAVDLMRAGSCTDCTGIVRVPPGDVGYIKRLVDAGAEAILVPMVETAEQARGIVEACRFPPRGNRGDASSVTRSSSYGFVGDYYARANDNLLLMMQIETVAAANNAREIAGVDGVDLIFIGPNDLSGSVGVPGQTNDPEVERLIARIVDASRQAGKPLGSVPRQGNSWQRLFDDGYQLVATGSDIASYRDFLAALAEQRAAAIAR